MILVLSVTTLERLADPANVIADARRWSEQVGVAGEADDAVVETVERAGADPDFVSGESGLAGNLAAIRQRFSTDRHVFVGTDDEQRGIAQALGWEFLPCAEAAEKAGWPLVDSGHTIDSGDADE